jgi:hypothetical protein
VVSHEGECKVLNPHQFAPQQHLHQPRSRIILKSSTYGKGGSGGCIVCIGRPGDASVPRPQFKTTGRLRRRKCGFILGNALPPVDNRLLLTAMRMRLSRAPCDRGIGRVPLPAQRKRPAARRSSKYDQPQSSQLAGC